jgi:hypothetical protein
VSSLRKFQKNPKHLLNTALTMFRSKKIQTAVVEGVCDKRFLSQWMSPENPLRFDGFDGKELVELAYADSKSKPYSAYDFLYFFADVDFDVLVQRGLNRAPTFFYNAFCFDENRLHYNDLETYLLNTKALEKVLVNFDIEAKEASSLRELLERGSRLIGSLRAADVIVKRANRLSSSVLNGLDIRALFNARDLSFNEAELFKALPNWSNYREHTDELIETAQRLNRESPTEWHLSRGHDVTEMLALHLEQRGNRGMTPEKVELLLRLACELDDFRNSPMGKQLDRFGRVAASKR